MTTLVPGTLNQAPERPERTDRGEVRAVWYRARGNLRGRLAGTIGLIVALAVTTGVVFTAMAGARRAHEALPDFVAYDRPYDALVFADPSPDVQTVIDDVAALPQWELAQQIGAVVVSVRRGDRWVSVVPAAYLDGRPYLDQERPIIVEGRLPDPSRPDEVAVNEDFAAALGLHSGDRFALRTVTPESLGPIIGGQRNPPDPQGEHLAMTVAGIIRRPWDLRLTAQPVNDVVGSDSWYVGVGPAFVDRFGDRLANFGFGVAGQVRPGQQDELADAIAALDRDDLTLRATNEDAPLIASIARGIDVEANALTVFALITALAGIAFVAQALGRQVFFDLDDDEALRGVGVDRRHRAAVPLVRSAVVVVIGAVGAVTLAIAASSAFPIGLARQAVLHTGMEVDPIVLGVGAASVVLLAMGWATVDAWRLTGVAATPAPVERNGRRTASISGLIARARAPVSMTAGVQLALERGRGRTEVPVVGAVLAATAGVVVLCAVLVFAASLDHLVSTPIEQGWNWDAVVGNMNSREDVRDAVTALEGNPDVGTYRGYGTGPVLVDGHEVNSLVLGPGDPHLGPPVLEGRLPVTSDEVAVGRDTLAAFDKSIGDSVAAQIPGARGDARTFRIVGTVILPAGLDTQLAFGRGVVVTLPGARATIGGGPDAVIPQQFLVRFADGVTATEAADSLRPAFGEDAADPRQASDVDNLQRVQRLPRLLAVLVTLLALGTLANALVTSVRRHRRDLATYAALGFRRRQLAATVAWQATTLAAVAVVVGIPLGVAAGRAVWQLVGDSIGITAAPELPTAGLALIAVGTMLAANFIAAVPAWSAARTHPATVLRSE